MGEEKRPTYMDWFGGIKGEINELRKIENISKSKESLDRLAKIEEFTNAIRNRLVMKNLFHEYDKWDPIIDKKPDY